MSGRHVVGPTDELPIPVLAGIIARFQMNFDPRRLDGTQAEVLVGTWRETLQGIHPDDAEAVCADILADPTRAGPSGFPSVGEFRQACTARARRRMDVLRDEHGEAAGVCPECLGLKLVWSSKAVSEVIDADGKLVRYAALYEAVNPCPVCCVLEYEFWAAGHYDKDHNVHTCEHERCQRRAASGRSRR